MEVARTDHALRMNGSCKVWVRHSQGPPLPGSATPRIYYSQGPPLPGSTCPPLPGSATPRVRHFQGEPLYTVSEHFINSTSVSANRYFLINSNFYLHYDFSLISLPLTLW